MAFRHAKVSSKPDGSDNTLIQPSDWNADHMVTGQTSGDLLYFNGTEWTRLAVGSDPTTPGVGTLPHIYARWS